MKKLNKLLFIAAIALIFLLQQPVISTTNNQTILEIEQQAEQLYQQNQYAEAIALLKTAIKQYQRQGDQIGGAIATRNLALIYQKLGEWEQAQTSLAEAAKIIATIKDESKQSQLLAQVGEVKGQVELSLGNAQAALGTWKQATDLYEEQGNITGLVQGKIYQASALQELGLYTQSIKILTATKEQLQTQPDTIMKAQALLNLGDIFNRIGKYQSAQTTLQSGLAIAKRTRLRSKSVGLRVIAEKLAANLTMAEIYLNLGNNARLQNQTSVALNYYQEAIKLAPQSDLQLRGKLEQLGVLVSLPDSQMAANLVTEIQQLLKQLPIQQTTIQAEISLARYLLDLNTPAEQIAALLIKAVKQAKNLGIIKTEAEAWGELGHLYELNQQWQAAATLTERALVKAQSLNAKELTYQWQWQLGRIFKAQGQRDKAIAAYTQATANLESLRSDLIAISSNVQYSFRAKIEPVYRQLATLLLEPGASQEDLNQARQIIESLQIAELDNFFRDACLDTQPQQIDQLDPTAAVIYTIILGDRLEVIAAIPGQPLRHYSNDLPLDEIELVLTSANSQLLQPRRLNLGLFQQGYDWLVRPFEAELKTSNIKTLVFVADGILRNLPPATLHDGQQYLIEKYSVAIAPSLQLAQLQTTVSDSQDLLLAGLSESRQGFTSLPGVKKEIEQIQPLFASSVLLNSNFTQANFDRFTNQTPFRVVHLATHGQFSSNAEDTYVLTWDDRINIEELNRLLRGDSKQLRPIDLLVLSACQTATGDRLATLGLAGIAVRAGARSTVASLWAVNDSATVTLMTHFYQALAQDNMTKAEALRQAQILTMKNEPFAHPYYWSAFILVGNWR
jgi:CHAT domain-containing protein